MYHFGKEIDDVAVHTSVMNSRYQLNILEYLPSESLCSGGSLLSK
jgi:hypothetical protein